MKDETSFARFVFDWAHEQTELSIADQVMDSASWHTLLNDLLAYSNQLKDLGGNLDLRMTNAII